MSIRFACAACGKSVSAVDEAAGRKVKCPCGQVLAVPKPEPKAAPQVEPKPAPTAPIQKRPPPPKPSPPRNELVVPARQEVVPTFPVLDRRPDERAGNIYVSVQHGRGSSFLAGFGGCAGVTAFLVLVLGIGLVVAIFGCAGCGALVSYKAEEIREQQRREKAERQRMEPPAEKAK